MTIKLGFNKRVMLAKKTLNEKITNSKELDTIKGCKSSGFYSLKTIYKYLYPVLEKYDLDLELEKHEKNYTGIWLDLESDNSRSVHIDFTRLINVPKLSLMANIVQSEGAIMTYLRRYSLTQILGLPSTDLLESPEFDKIANQQTPTYTQPSQPSQPAPTYSNKVSVPQLKRLYRINKTLEINNDYFIELVKVAYNLKSRNDLTKSDYKNLTEYMVKADTEKSDILNNLIKKIESKGKKVPKPDDAKKPDIKSETDYSKGGTIET